MLTRGHRMFCFLLLSLCSAVLLKGSGQAPQEKPAAAQIRVHTGEVVVDVSVTDGDGKPVRGLTQSDFEVYEDGVKQQIASFRFIAPTTSEPGPLSAQNPAKTAAPSELSAETPEYPHLISLVFDKVNASGPEASRAANAARFYVEKSLHKNDQAAVFRIGMGVHIYQRFTSDRASLIKAIQEAVSGGSRDPGDVSEEIRTALASTPGEGFIPGVYTDNDKIAFAYSADFIDLQKYPQLQDLLLLLKFQEIDREVRSDRTLTGLLSVIESQKVIPGRKSLIFLSSGFTLPTGGNQYSGGATAFRSVAAAANRAGVTIYSVDIAGLRGSDPEADRQNAQQVASKSRAIVGPNTLLGLLSSAMGLNTLDNLEMLSEETGGYTVRNTNDLVAGMERIGAYVGEYYVLTYMPSNLVHDAKFHAIAVKLARPRLNVSARKGYYAIPDTDRLPLLGYEAELLEDINANAPPSHFPVYVGGYSFTGRNDTSTAALFVQFPLSQLKIEKHRDTKSYLAQADILMLVKKTDQSVVYRLSQRYNLEGSLDNLDNTQKKDFSFQRRMPLAPGNYVLEAIVRDRGTGDASVRKTAFKVASPDQAILQPGSLMLSKGSILAARDEASENPFRLENPLLVEGVNVLPDLSAVYRKSTDKEITVYFVAQTHAASPQIQATLEFLGAGAPDTKLQRTLPPPDETGRIRCITRVGLDLFKPGKYEMRVTVTDAGRSASGTAQFRVER